MSGEYDGDTSSKSSEGLFAEAVHMGAAVLPSRVSRMCSGAADSPHIPSLRAQRDQMSKG